MKTNVRGQAVRIRNSPRIGFGGAGLRADETLEIRDWSRAEGLGFRDVRVLKGHEASSVLGHTVDTKESCMTFNIYYSTIIPKV